MRSSKVSTYALNRFPSCRLLLLLLLLFLSIFFTFLVLIFFFFLFKNYIKFFINEFFTIFMLKNDDNDAYGLKFQYPIYPKIFFKTILFFFLKTKKYICFHSKSFICLVYSYYSIEFFQIVFLKLSYFVNKPSL